MIHILYIVFLIIFAYTLEYLSEIVVYGPIIKGYQMKRGLTFYLTRNDLVIINIHKSIIYSLNKSNIEFITRKESILPFYSDIYYVANSKGGCTGRIKRNSHMESKIKAKEKDILKKN